MLREQPCTRHLCFFSTMNEPDPAIRRSKIAQCFREMPLTDDPEHVLALSGLWSIAMSHPDDSEFPRLGIFECMAKFIDRGINDKAWLLRDQNIYIPYYAAHIIGSYTMNKVNFAEKAVKSGVVLPLLELLRGKISWVEQRVAVCALSHLSSYDTTFEAIAEHEVEIIELTMELACSCLKNIYKRFLGVEDRKRLKYHCDLLTRGRGGLEMENSKAEEWAVQLQSWSLYLLNSFACKERCLDLICKKQFLKELCGMRGGFADCKSPGGLGLVRNLCNTNIGRKSIANVKNVIESLGNISRSSDHWQYMAIDCVLLLLKDMDIRIKVMEIAVPFLVDLIELRSLGERKNIRQVITQSILQDYHKVKYGGLKLKSEKAERALKETWDLKVERRKREKLMSEQEMNERKQLVGILKHEGNKKCWSGHFERAIANYTKALDLCPLKTRKERMVLYSNRAQCHLLLRNPEAAISDATRALCLSSATSPHRKSLWRRSQAYDLKGLARESLVDCLMFINGRGQSNQTNHFKIPYYAAPMIKKQMKATWPFAAAKSEVDKQEEQAIKSDGLENGKSMTKTMDIKKKKTVRGMPTIEEDFFLERQDKAKRRREIDRLARVKMKRLTIKLGDPGVNDPSEEH